MNAFWALYGLLILGLLAELITPSPPPEEKAEIPAMDGISDLPQEEGRGAQGPGELAPGADNSALLARLERMED